MLLSQITYRPELQYVGQALSILAMRAIAIYQWQLGRAYCALRREGHARPIPDPAKWENASDEGA
jgi:hypothetical protein